MGDFRMPSLGADMEAGTLVEWKVKPGDVVKRGDIVALVETQKGMVYLRGKVDSDAAKSAAEEVARGVEGVQAVRNELQVVPAAAKKVVEDKDDEITKQVKDRLKNDARLKSIDVRTDNGVVTLQGKVSNINDSVKASQLAREVPGVRSVRNDTTYDSPRASKSDTVGCQKLPLKVSTDVRKVKSLRPAITITAPSGGELPGSVIIACSACWSFMSGSRFHSSKTGSYTSAPKLGANELGPGTASGSPLKSSNPPATSTCPLVSLRAVCPRRAKFMFAT